MRRLLTGLLLFSVIALVYLYPQMQLQPVAGACVWTYQITVSPSSVQGGAGSTFQVTVTYKTLNGPDTGDETINPNLLWGYFDATQSPQMASYSYSPSSLRFTYKGQSQSTTLTMVTEPGVTGTYYYNPYMTQRCSAGSQQISVTTT